METSKSETSFILIHGAWAEGSSWSGVIEQLQAEGYRVTAPQFPLTSLADDVARLAGAGPPGWPDCPRRALLRWSDHDGAGCGPNERRRTGLHRRLRAGRRRVTGCPPGEGPVTPALAHQFVDQRGFVWLSEDDFVNHFAADADPVKARVLYAVQQPLAARIQ